MARKRGPSGSSRHPVDAERDKARPDQGQALAAVGSIQNQRSAQTAVDENAADDDVCDSPHGENANRTHKALASNFITFITPIASPRFSNAASEKNKPARVLKKAVLNPAIALEICRADIGVDEKIHEFRPPRCCFRS